MWPWCGLLAVSLCLAQAQIESGICDDFTKRAVPPQNILYINVIGPDFSTEMKVLDTLLRPLVTKYRSTLQLADNTTVGDLDAFSQIWIGDLSTDSDNSPQKISLFRKVAQWWQHRNKPHIICDGRLLASLWDISHPRFPGREGRPNERLVENYLVNLAVRGGGLVLGTDNGPEYTEGINLINDALGLSRFEGWAYEPGVWLAEVDLKSPLLTWPAKATHHDNATSVCTSLSPQLTSKGISFIWADSSSSLAPFGLQPNGLIFHAVAWHKTMTESKPSVTSTISGNSGLRVAIRKPACRIVISQGTSTTFQAQVTKGSPLVSWTWSSDLDGNFGTTADISTRLSIGRHVVRVRAVDAQRNIAEDRVIVNVVSFSPNNTCYALAYNKDREITEYYPIQRANSPSLYYHYDAPRKARANTNDRLEERRKRSANFFLYQEESGVISFVTILSENNVESNLKLKIEVDTPFTPKIRLRDGPTDRSVSWNPRTLTATADFKWKDTTKGVIIGPITNNNSRERACVLVTVLGHPANVDYLVFHGHVKPSSKATNPEALTLYEYDALVNTTIRICHTQCSCSKPETITTLSGEVESLSTEFGTSYTFTSASGILDTQYSDKVKCTWLFSPPGVAGIGFQFASWDVKAGDAVTLYKGENSASNKLIDAYSGSAIPGPSWFENNKGGVMFEPNNDGKRAAGFMAVPTLTSTSPTAGPYLVPNNIRLTGKNFVAGTIFVKIGSIIVTNVMWLSNEQIEFDVPAQPESMLGKKLVISVSNDGIYYSSDTNVIYQFIDSECVQLTDCAACNAKRGCDWCNNLDRPALSYCFNATTDTCSTGSSESVIDDTCCTQCTNNNGCSSSKGKGACLCNNTCSCNPPNYGPSCECIECEKDSEGRTCNGRGTCKCDGTCECEFGYSGISCECSSCEGEPVMCSGHGKCDCSGSCVCDEGWTSSNSNGVCDCPNSCPNDCSGKGKCECGLCVCLPGYALLPDCSCKEFCDDVCTGNRVCGCSGKCECAEGFYGDDCTETVDCSPFYACATCVQNPACAWCPGAYKCENKLSLSYCDVSDRANNPLSFVAVTEEDCPTSESENTLLTAGDGGLVAGGIAGGILALIVALLSGAIFLTNKPVSGPLVDGYE